MAVEQHWSPRRHTGESEFQKQDEKIQTLRLYLPRVNGLPVSDLHLIGLVTKLRKDDMYPLTGNDVQLHLGLIEHCPVSRRKIPCWQAGNKKVLVPKNPPAYSWGKVGSHTYFRGDSQSRNHVSTLMDTCLFSSF